MKLIIGILCIIIILGLITTLLICLIKKSKCYKQCKENLSSSSSPSSKPLIPLTPSNHPSSTFKTKTLDLRAIDPETKKTIGCMSPVTKLNFGIPWGEHIKVTDLASLLTGCPTPGGSPDIADPKYGGDIRKNRFYTNLSAMGFTDEQLLGDEIVKGGLDQYIHDNCRMLIESDPPVMMAGHNISDLARKTCCTPENGCLTSDCCAQRLPSDPDNAHGGCGKDGGWNPYVNDYTIKNSDYVKTIHNKCDDTNYAFAYDDLSALRICSGDTTQLEWVLCPNGNAGGYEELVPTTTSTPTPAGQQQPSMLRVNNQCPFDVWIGSSYNPDQPGKIDSNVHIPSGGIHDYSIQPGELIDSGRLWAKVGCDGNGENCLVGQSVGPGCSEKYGCQPPISSKMELTNAIVYGEKVMYTDTSGVDGYTIPFNLLTKNNDNKKHPKCTNVTCNNLSLSSCPTAELVPDYTPYTAGGAPADFTGNCTTAYNCPVGTYVCETGEPGVPGGCYTDDNKNTLRKPVCTSYCLNKGIEAKDLGTCTSSSCSSGYWECVDGNSKGGCKLTPWNQPECDTMCKTK